MSAAVPRLVWMRCPCGCPAPGVHINPALIEAIYTSGADVHVAMRSGQAFAFTASPQWVIDTLNIAGRLN
jgi:hypothetical protein